MTIWVAPALLVWLVVVVMWGIFGPCFWFFSVLSMKAGGWPPSWNIGPIELNYVGKRIK